MAHLSGEHFTHRSLWHAGDHLVEVGERDEVGGWNATLAAALFTYLALEAYLNFAGEAIAPEAWRDERRFFSTSTEYRGTLGKLDLILDRLEIPYDRGRAPYSSIIDLHERRNWLVHARPERVERVVEFKRGDNPRIEWRFNTLVTEEYVRQVRENVEEMADSIQEGLLKRGDRRAFGPKAFIGAISHQGGFLG